MQQHRIRVQPLRQMIQPPAKQFEDAGDFVLCNPTRFEKDVYTLAELRRTPVGGDDLIERGTRILPAGPVAVRIRAVL